MKVLKWFDKQARRWGSLGVSLFSLAIVAVIALAYFAGPEGYRAGSDVIDPPPGIPDELKEDLAQGCYDAAGNYITAEDLMCTDISRPELEGPQVGATGSASYGRPSAWLERVGLKFEWAPTTIWSQRGFNDPVAIVVHVTGGGTCNGIRDYFKSNDRRVSAHFLVCDGRVLQQVETGDGAHHAGIWGARFDSTNPMILDWYRRGINPNSVTVGIETLIACNGDHIDNFPEMRRALVQLIAWAGIEHDILIDRSHVIAHAQLDAVNRSRDPYCGMDLDAIVRDAAAVAYGANTPACPGPVDEGTGLYWDRCISRWVAADGWSFDPVTLQWHNPTGVAEWTPCNQDSLRWNLEANAWFPPGSAFFEPSRGFWSLAGAC